MAISDASTTVRNVEQLKHSEGSAQALHDLSAEYNSYANSHTKGDTAKYWDNVTSQLHQDGVLKDLAITWGAENHGKSPDALALSNPSDLFTHSMSNELKTDYVQAGGDRNTAATTSADEMSRILQSLQGDTAHGAAAQAPAPDAGTQKLVGDLKSYAQSDQPFDRNTIDEFKTGIKTAYDSGSTPEQKDANEAAYIKELNAQLAGSGLSIESHMQRGLGSAKQAYELKDSHGNEKDLSYSAKWVESQEAAQKGYDAQRSQELQNSTNAQQSAEQQKEQQFGAKFANEASQLSAELSRGSLGDAAARQHILDLYQDASNSGLSGDGKDLLNQKINEAIAASGYKIVTAGLPNVGLGGANHAAQTITLEKSNGQAVDSISYHEQWQNGSWKYAMDH